MMGPLSRTVLVSLAALGTLSTPVALAADAPVTNTEVARRQLAMRDAMQELQEARLAYSAKRYSEAVEHYRSALSVLPKSTATEKQQRFIKDSLSDALIAKAIDYRKVGRRDEAVEFLQEAIKLSPDNQRAQLELAHTNDAARTNPALSPQHIAEVEEVSRLLTQAYGHMDLGQYDEAIETFQAVRKYDAYNTAALRGMEQAQRRRNAYFRTAYASARAKALAEVDSSWDEKLPVEMQTADAQLGEFSTGQAVEEAEFEQAYADTLAQMVLPQIIFEEASITEIMETLQNQIRRFEAGEQGASRPISILSNFGTPDSAGYKELMNKRVNLTLSQVSVRDVLDLLTRQLGITYYYTPLGVELSYSGKDFGPLIDRSFTVAPHFFDADEAEEDEDDEEDAFGGSAPRVSVRRVNPMDVFKAMGISFPEGAIARYMPSTRTLHVRNTAHNMEAIKEAINVPMSELRQILLNVVIMQVSERDLEELGFDWLLNVSLSPDGNLFAGGGVTQAASMATGLPLFTGVREEEGSYMTEGLRTGARAITQSSMERLIETGGPAAYMERPTPKAPGIFSLRGIWNAADLTFIMRGLSQKKGTDMLQNPQLVLSPGSEEQVTFANVREMYYPEEYEQGELKTATGRVVTERNYEDYAWDDDDGIEDAYYMMTMIATGAQPSSFVRYGMTEEGAGGIGAILQVHTAEVMDNNLVKLDLTTTVNDFEGFVNWGTPIMGTLYKMPDWSMVESEKEFGRITKFPLTDPQTVTLSPNRILKPIFKRSVVNTSVVVEPGTVLVFAGLKEGKKVRYEDKVPVLGDLPLVGRFFRSSGEETVRKVLIYFAKVDLVDPAGRDVNTGERPVKLNSGL